MPNDLPLLELFDRLRKAGLPLGVSDYQLMVKALQRGFGIPDREALARLCCTLWIKSTEEERIFDYHFEQLFPKVKQPKISEKKSAAIKQPIDKKIGLIQQFRPSLKVLFLTGIITLLVMLGMALALSGSWQNIRRDGAGSKKNIGDTNSSDELVDQKVEESPENSIVPPQNAEKADAYKEAASSEGEKAPRRWAPEQIISIGSVITASIFASTFSLWLILQWLENRKQKREPDKSRDNPKEGPTIPEMIHSSNYPVQLASMSEQNAAQNQPQTDANFLRPMDYLPMTRRQMKQSWRFLRRPVRSGPRTELDIDATVNRFSRQGGVLEPVLVPRRVNQTELLILSDHEGSMVPFHGVSQRLVETARQAGRLGKTNLYYFANCPKGYLYHDPYFQDSQSIHDLLLRHVSKRTVVMIISDAGAARGGFNQQRLNLTGKFLQLFRSHVGHIVWLNPMPRERWENTTAVGIAQQVSMFEFSRHGLQQSVDILRGR